jgi:AcrR family transcriptional regulator
VSAPVKRLSRAERQDLTRAALLDAAIHLFVERGIDATSIEEVTAYAGFTRGAFYSNFASKDELVIEAGRRFLENLHAAALPVGRVPEEPGNAYKERVERLRPVAEGGPDIFLAEFTLYAIRHPEIAEAMAELHRRQLQPAVEFVKTQLHAAGAKKPAGVSYETLANIVQCLTFATVFFGRIDAPVAAERSVEIATRALFNGLQ